MSAVLTRPVLMLNKNWMPIEIQTVESALGKVFAERAKIIAPEDYQLYTWEEWSQLKPTNDEDVLQSVKDCFRVPEVVLSTTYSKVPRRKSIFNRRGIWRRDGFICQYCGRRPANDEITIDHILPRSKGGTSTWLNCVLSCLTCNVKKANRTPEEAGMKLLRQPFEPKFHFRFTISKPIESWSKFISDCYWTVPLENQ